MDYPIAPCIQRALIHRAQHPTFGYTIQPQRAWRAVSSWLTAEHGWKVDEEAFVFSPNLINALAGVLETCTSVGDGVLVLLPLYTPIQDVIRKLGRRLVTQSLQLIAGAGGGEASEFAVDIAAFEQVILRESAKMFVLCSPHNPTGKVWSRPELRSLLNVCKKHGVLVISDEIHSDLVLKFQVPRATTGVQSMESGERVVAARAHQPHVPTALVCEEIGYLDSLVTLYSPSKSWGLAGLHASCLVIPSQQLRLKYLAAALPTHRCFGGVFATACLLAAYESKSAKAWLQAYKRSIQENILFLEEFLSSNPPLLSLVKACRPQASFLVWLDFSSFADALQLEFKSGPDSEMVRFLLDKAKCKLSDGYSFGGVAFAQWQRINVACSRSKLHKALSQLRDAAALRMTAEAEARGSGPSAPAASPAPSA